MDKLLKTDVQELEKKLDLSYYKGNDKYSEGYIEDIMLRACLEDNEEQLLRNERVFPVLYHLSDMRRNLLEWYPFNGNEEVLEVGSGCGALTGLLSEKCKKVTCVELSKKRSLINAKRNKEKNNVDIRVGNFQDCEKDLGYYNIIFLIGVLEYSSSFILNEKNPYLWVLNTLKNHLRTKGRIIIAIENKMGLKYWNGAWEDHTDKQ